MVARRTQMCARSTQPGETMPDDLPILDFVPGGPLSILIAFLVWTVVVILATKFYVVRRASSDVGYLADLAGKFARAKAKADGLKNDLDGIELRAKARVAAALDVFEREADELAAKADAAISKLTKKD
jgi:hypothetical protein